jgi:hypothetical protein
MSAVHVLYLLANMFFRIGDAEYCCCLCSANLHTRATKSLVNMAIGWWWQRCCSPVIGTDCGWSV